MAPRSTWPARPGHGMLDSVDLLRLTSDLVYKTRLLVCALRRLTWVAAVSIIIFAVFAVGVLVVVLVVK